MRCGALHTAVESQTGAIYGRILWGELLMVRYGSRSGVVTEVSQGQEGLPEASLGCVVVQRWGEGGSKEASRALGPGEPHAGFCYGEGLPDEGMVDGVDIAGCACAYRHEDVGFRGMNLVGEQPGRLVGYVGSLQTDGLQAELEGLEGAGAVGLFEHEHDP